MEQYLHPSIYFQHMTFNQAQSRHQFSQLKICHPLTGHQANERVRGIALPRTGHLTSRKETWYLLYRRLSGTLAWSEWVRKILPHWDLNAEPSSHSELLYNYTIWGIFTNEYYKEKNGVMKGFNFNMFCTIKRRKVWVQLLLSHCITWVYSVTAMKNEDCIITTTSTIV